MAKDQILIRDVPEHVRDWIDQERYRLRLSLKELLISLLEQAARGEIRPSLFDALERPAQPVVGSLIPFRFIDLFAGIGGFRIGLTKLGGVDSSDSLLTPHSLCVAAGVPNLPSGLLPSVDRSSERCWFMRVAEHTDDAISQNAVAYLGA